MRIIHDHFQNFLLEFYKQALCLDESLRCPDTFRIIVLSDCNESVLSGVNVEQIHEPPELRLAVTRRKSGAGI